MMSDNFLCDLTAARMRLAKAQAQLSSGKRLKFPSDDPVGAGVALRLRSSLVEVGQYQKNTKEALNWLDVTETALGSAVSILQRARELAVYGANGTLPQSSLEAIAAEVDQLLDHLVQVANTTYGPRYVLGGHKTMAAPFTLNLLPVPQVVYNGDGGMIVREIGVGISTTINVPGDEVFINNGDSFDALIGLAQDLRAGDTVNISQVRVGELDQCIDWVLAVWSRVGAERNRLELTDDRLKNIDLSLSSLLGETEDVDFARAFMELNIEENAYRTALATGARIIQPSLVDFLR